MQNFHTFQIATYLCCYAYRYTSIFKGAISCRLIEALSSEQRSVKEEDRIFCCP
jgi:hypothetical protein